MLFLSSSKYCSGFYLNEFLLMVCQTVAPSPCCACDDILCSSWCPLNWVSGNIQLVNFSITGLLSVLITQLYIGLANVLTISIKKPPGEPSSNFSPALMRPEVNPLLFFRLGCNYFTGVKAYPIRLTCVNWEVFWSTSLSYAIVLPGWKETISIT